MYYQVPNAAKKIFRAENKEFGLVKLKKVVLFVFSTGSKGENLNSPLVPVLNTKMILEIEIKKFKKSFFLGI
jgi:hypothetical protein